MTDYQDVIAAFADGEAIGAEDLAPALASPEGREYLIDLLVLRGLVGDAHGTGRTGRVTEEAGPPKHRARWLTAAAACLAVGVAAGFFAGRVTPGGSRAADMRVAGEVSAPVETTTAAPAPTHVIRLESGVDWSERSGGN